MVEEPCLKKTFRTLYETGNSVFDTEILLLHPIFSFTLWPCLA